jgi:hypothetical protein
MPPHLYGIVLPHRTLPKFYTIERLGMCIYVSL